MLVRDLDKSGLEVHGQKITTLAQKTQHSSNWVSMTQKDTWLRYCFKLSFGIPKRACLHERNRRKLPAGKEKQK